VAVFLLIWHFLVFGVMCLSSLEQGVAVVRLKQNMAAKSCIMNGVSSMGVYQCGDKTCQQCDPAALERTGTSIKQILSLRWCGWVLSALRVVWFDST